MLARDKKRREKIERVGFTIRDTHECQTIVMLQEADGYWCCELSFVGLEETYCARASSAEKSFVAAMKQYRARLLPSQ